MPLTGRYLFPALPDKLSGLLELALDLRWSWSPDADAIWQDLDPQTWKLTRNPWLILQTMSTKELESLAGDAKFRKTLEKTLKTRRSELKAKGWFQKNFSKAKWSVGYFSMEFGLSEALPIYSGGLGMLAGDHLKTCSDLGVPLVGVGLLYRQGYFRQLIDADGNQMASYPVNDPSHLPVVPLRDKNGKWISVEVNFPGHPIKLNVWQAQVGRVTLYLLDSNDPTNFPTDRGITSELYGGGSQMRLQQELVLGIGGWRLLCQLGTPPAVCHLNEGHAAFAVLERARQYMEKSKCDFWQALAATRGGNLFTTHTPVAAGFDRFDRGLVARYVERYARERLGITLDDIMNLGREKAGDENEPLNMAYLAIHGASGVNGVSALHGKVSRYLFASLFPRWPTPEIPVTSITNGVNVPAWESSDAESLWDDVCGQDRWLGDMDRIESDLDAVEDGRLWAFRKQGRVRLVNDIRERHSHQLEMNGDTAEAIDAARSMFDENILTLGFARRFATYKRPNLLLTDPDRLARILTNPDRPVQIVVAGKAHPADAPGQAMVKQWVEFAKRPDVAGHCVFLADYDMSMAEHLVSGVDVWINTPRRPWEASGTSGMKVLVNGGLNCSELDGWWAEAYTSEVGWALGDGQEHGEDSGYDVAEAEQLYALLENDIVPLYYDQDENGIAHGWVAKMRASMARLTPAFSTNRMVRDYVNELYAPAALRFSERSAKKGAPAAKLLEAINRINTGFDQLRFGRLETREEDGNVVFTLPVFLGNLEAGDVTVQLYADNPDQTPDIHPMERDDELPGAGNGHVYTITISTNRLAQDYTPRIVPTPEGLVVPLELNHILWYA
ncbi:alpha-glucan family phosphorylase [Desulfovibrio inopinatus]|uniref:alpha-glucan family phosphorylase n=1 Tax=Desulfovibrio inopinatus TaxID=102109 RepID=UPI00040E3E38|nr:alpha-glucan family phosphorylase [Desulfovibrio inopinatus]